MTDSSGNEFNDSIPVDGDELTDEDLEAVAGGQRFTLYHVGTRGGQAQGGSEPDYQCQVYGSGNMGTHNEIDTEMSVF